METCKSCRFWKRATDDGSEYAVSCLIAADPITYEPLEPQPFEIGQCELPRFSERPEKNGTAVIDGSDYFAALVTGEDFGCVRHEPVNAQGRAGNAET